MYLGYMNGLYRVYVHSIALFHYFFFNDTATTEIYTLSLHDALPISMPRIDCPTGANLFPFARPSLEDTLDVLPEIEEHTSELQSQSNLVCRLLLEKKKTTSAILDYYVLSVIHDSPLMLITRSVTLTL